MFWISPHCVKLLRSLQHRSHMAMPGSLFSKSAFAALTASNARSVRGPLRRVSNASDSACDARYGTIRREIRTHHHDQPSHARAQRACGRVRERAGLRRISTGTVRIK